MSTHTNVWDEEAERPLPKVPWAAAVSAALVPLLFLPVCWSLGWAEWMVGPAPHAMRALVTTGVFAMAVHGCLVWPLCGFVFPQYAGRWGLFERTIVTLALFTPPLLSFLSLQSGEGPTDFADLALSVVPAVALGTFLYERTERPWLFSLTLALAVSLPWLWVGDRLNGFSPLVFYGIFDSRAPVLRVVVSGFAMAAGAFALARRQALDAAGLRTVGKTLAVLGGVHLAVSVLIPLVTLLVGKTGAPLSPHWTLVLYPWLILACLKPRALGLKAFKWLLAIAIFGELLEVGWLISTGGVGLNAWKQAREITSLLSASLLGGTYWRFFRLR